MTKDLFLYPANPACTYYIDNVDGLGNGYTYVQDCGDVTIPTLHELSAELVPLVRHDLLVALDDEDRGGDGDGVLEAVRLRHGDW